MAKTHTTRINLVTIGIYLLLGLPLSAFSQDLCDANKNPNLISDGFELLTPNVGCGPFEIKLKNKTEGTDIKYIYYYQGQDKSKLPSLGPVTNTQNTYFKPEVTSNYTILQYGIKPSGDAFYSCKNVTVNSSSKPSFSYSICSSGIELVIPKDDINSAYTVFKIDVLKTGFSRSVAKSELPITLNIPMNYPDELKLEGIESGQQGNCNLVTLNLNPKSNPSAIDAPFDVNIDTLELVEKSRARIVFNGSLDKNGYTLQMRESQGNYPDIPLMKNIVPKNIEVDLPDANKSYCFKLSRQMLCNSYEFSAEICTTPITNSIVTKYGEITLDWLNHTNPSTGQTFNQKKEIEINKVNKSISSENLPLSQNSFSYIMSCGVNKVCFVISNKIKGEYYNYQYLGTSISNEVCITSDSIIAPPISNLFTTINDNQLVDVFFKPNELWETPVSKFFLNYLGNQSPNPTILDSSIAELSFDNLQLPIYSENCFTVSYIDTCGIKSEHSKPACTIALNNDYASNLKWSASSPFINDQVIQYKLLALNETENTFDEINDLPSSQLESSVELSNFKNLALFKIKAISFSGQTSFSNPIEIPLEFKLFVPEAFSPNYDGINDDFQIYGTLNKIKDFNIRIFNRDGSVVFQSNLPDFKWDGLSNKNAISKGVYNYFISLISQYNEQISKQGSFTLF